MYAFTLRPRSFLLALSVALPTAGCFDVDSMDPSGVDTDTGTGTNMGESTNPELGGSTGDPSTSGPPSTSNPSTSGGEEPGTTGHETDASDSDSDSNSSGAVDSEGDSSTGVAELAPQVSMTAPAHGEAGVRSDVALQIVFDERMDQAATQAAYQSADIPASDVTFSWNEQGNTLTVTPTAELQYAIATSTDDPARSYHFTITTTAQSDAGVALEDDVEVDFTTLRRFAQTFVADSSLTGAVRDLAGPISAGNLGDTNTNDVGRYFMTFDLSSMAPGMVDLEFAEYDVTRSPLVSGSPFTDLGDVVSDPVSFDALNAATFDVEAHGKTLTVFSSANDLDGSVAVQHAVANFVEHPDIYGTNLQFRLRWISNETDGDNSYDGITINENSDPPQLQLLYLAP